MDKQEEKSIIDRIDDIMKKPQEEGDINVRELTQLTREGFGIIKDILEKMNANSLILLKKLEIRDKRIEALREEIDELKKEK